MQPVGGISITPEQPKNRATERGDLLTYFTTKLNAERPKMGLKPLPIRTIAVRVGHLSLSDLYYLKSCADDYQRRGNPWGKYFWGSLKLRK